MADFLTSLLIGGAEIGMGVLLGPAGALGSQVLGSWLPAQDLLAAALFKEGLSTELGAMVRGLAHPATQHQNREQAVTSATAYLPVIYGRARIGCHLAYVCAEGGNKWLWYVGGVCHGEIGGFDEIYVDGALAVKADGTIRASQPGFVTVTSSALGADGLLHVETATAHDYTAGDNIDAVYSSMSPATIDKNAVFHAWVVYTVQDTTHFTLPGYADPSILRPADPTLGAVRRNTPGYQGFLGFVKYVGADDQDQGSGGRQDGTATSGGKDEGGVVMYAGGTSPATNSLVAHAAEWAKDGGLAAPCPIGKGVAYLILKLKWDSARFRSSVPQVSVIVHGKKVYDPRSAVAITSSSVANPTHLTTGAAHGRSPGDLVRIIGHSGSTPDINGVYRCGTGTTGSTVVLPINVSVGGTGGTLGVVAYSANPALCQRDYLTSTRYGRGAPDAFIYDANAAGGIAGEATMCGDGADNETGATVVLGQWVPADTGAFAVIGVSTVNYRVHVTAHGFAAGDDIYFLDTVTTPSVLGHQKVLAVPSADYFTVDDGTGNAVIFTVGGAQTNATVEGARQQETFRCDGMVDTSRSVRSNMETLLTASRAELYFQAGQYRIFTRRVVTPSTYALTADTVVGDVRTTLPGGTKAPNVYRISFIDAANNWQHNSFLYPPVDATNPYLLGDNGIRFERAMDLPFTNDKHMAEQICMVRLKEDRYGRAVALTAKESALVLGVGDIVPLTYDTPGWTAKNFWVRRVRILEPPIVGLALQEYAAAAYTYDLVPGCPKLLDSSLPNPFTPPDPPTDLILTTGSPEPRIAVSWTPVLDARVARYEVWAQRTHCGDATLSPDTDWRHYGSVNVTTPYTYIPGVTNDDIWKVQVRSLTELAMPSDGDNVAWSCAATCTVLLRNRAQLGSIGATADGTSITYTVPFGDRCDHVRCYSAQSSGGGLNLPAESLSTLVEDLRPALTGAPIGVNWLYTDLGAAHPYLRCVAYGNGAFVVGGDAGLIGRSVDDGKSWTWQTLAGFAGNGIYGLAWSGSTFVAVGNGGHVATSPDADIWTDQGTPAAIGGAFINAVCWGDGPDVFVAVCDGGVLATSPTGATWTAHTSGFGADNIRAVIWGGTTFVAAGFNGKISTSPTGTTWTAQTSGFGAGIMLLGLAYGNGTLLVAGGSTAAGTKVATSTDGGATWIPRTGVDFGDNGGGTLYYAWQAGFGNGLFVLTGSGNYATGFISADGISWAAVASGFRDIPSGFATADDAAPREVMMLVGFNGFAGAAIATSTEETNLPVLTLRVLTTANWYRTTTFVAYTGDNRRGDTVTVGPTQAVAAGGAPSAAPTGLALVAAGPYALTISWSNNGDATSYCRVWLDGTIISATRFWLGTAVPDIAPGTTRYTILLPMGTTPGASHQVAIDHFLNGQASTLDGPVTMATSAAGTAPATFTLGTGVVTRDNRGRSWTTYTPTWSETGAWEIRSAAVASGAAAPDPDVDGALYDADTVTRAATIRAVNPTAQTRDVYYWLRGTNPSTAWRALDANPLADGPPLLAA